MDMLEYPRIGNRSDALELLEKVITEADGIAGSPESTGEISMWALSISVALEALKDAIDRYII